MAGATRVIIMDHMSFLAASRVLAIIPLWDLSIEQSETVHQWAKFENAVAELVPGVDLFWGMAERIQKEVELNKVLECIHT